MAEITERKTVMMNITAFKAQIEGRSGLFVQPEQHKENV